jgi:hypothetical protein
MAAVSLSNHQSTGKTGEETPRSRFPITREHKMKNTMQFPQLSAVALAVLALVAQSQAIAQDNVQKEISKSS